MPFTLAREEPTAEPTPAPTPESTPEPTAGPTPEPAPVPEPPKKDIGVEKIAGAVILAVAVIFLVLYQKKNKGKDNKKTGKVKPPVQAPSDMPESGSQDGPEENATTILGGRYLLVLRDRANPERIFRYPMDGHVIVGRNIDMVQIPVDYNQTVSGQHCEFYIKNNRFFIRDMNSANHTYLEGTMVTGEREIVSGSIVRLGAAEFSVEFMPI